MFYLFLLLAALPSAFAATAEQWRSRSIYQIITDRYALPAGMDPHLCDPGSQTWCGGTWNTIRENLPYIQGMGFTAIWISPVHQNYGGPRTAYGDAYHGYWTTDISKLNPHFGTEQDLKDLSAALHARGMYLMVDVVVNHVAATTLTPDFSEFFFKDPSQYHPYCPIQYGNSTSETQCWMGDESVALVDVNTEDPRVVSAYEEWIGPFVQEYGIDGLRIDAAKHIRKDFWPGFCEKAGVFCMGEVFESSPAVASEYQGPLHSILNFPIYFALVEAFGIPGTGNMSRLVQVIEETRSSYLDTQLLGNFLECHDVPRWSNFSVDEQSMRNAMIFNFLSDGIPIVYYGQEQRFQGAGDPWNREPLWPSQYANSTTYQLITKLNLLRNFLTRVSDWATEEMTILTFTSSTIAIMKGPVISILTNIGSPPQNSSVSVPTPFERNLPTIDVLSCQQYAIGSGGTVSVEYTLGGKAVVLLPSMYLEGSGLCGADGPTLRYKSSARASSFIHRVFNAFFIVTSFILVTV